MTGSPLAVARAATRRFGSFTAVDGVDLAVAPGEVVGLLGANGAGKTTLIRLLLGVVRPSAGEVRLFGEAPSRSTRRRIGYVPQGLGLYADLTAAENLDFARSVFGAGAAAGAAARPPVDPAVAEAGDRPIGEVPLGVQRRVAFAQALGHRPALLVLDEPTSGVGPLAAARLWESIRAAAEEGAGVLVTTHSMEEAEECDRLVVMAAGRVVAEGTVAAIVGDATTVTVAAGDRDAAFARLDAAGLAVTPDGDRLRLAAASTTEVERALAAGPRVEATVGEAPATLEERFAALVTAAATP